MKAHAPPIATFLTEAERRIAEQVKRLRDLNARRDVVAGAGRQKKSGRRQRSTARSNVKDSHDRYA